LSLANKTKLKNTRAPVKHRQVAVIDTIVAKVQGVPGDDRCVLLLGYKEEMEVRHSEGEGGSEVGTPGPENLLPLFSLRLSEVLHIQPLEALCRLPPTPLAQTMMSKANPGLARRFQLQNAW
jgi:hypothetical protein